MKQYRLDQVEKTVKGEIVDFFCERAEVYQKDLAESLVNFIKTNAPTYGFELENDIKIKCSLGMTVVQSNLAFEARMTWKNYTLTVRVNEACEPITTWWTKVSKEKQDEFLETYDDLCYAAILFTKQKMDEQDAEKMFKELIKTDYRPGMVAK